MDEHIEEQSASSDADQYFSAETSVMINDGPFLEVNQLSYELYGEFRKPSVSTLGCWPSEQKECSSGEFRHPLSLRILCPPCYSPRLQLKPSETDAAMTERTAGRESLRVGEGLKEARRSSRTVIMSPRMRKDEPPGRVTERISSPSIEKKQKPAATDPFHRTLPHKLVKRQLKAEPSRLILPLLDVNKNSDLAQAYGILAQKASAAGKKRSLHTLVKRPPVF